MAVDLTILLTPAGRPPDAADDLSARLFLPAGLTLASAAQAIEDGLAVAPDIEYLDLVVAGRPAGTTSRSYLRTAFMKVTRAPGDGDGATLLGRSTQYVAVVFRCARCGQRALRAFYDERFIPECERSGHGPMARD